jgi:hypothetical protein
VTLAIILGCVLGGVTIAFIVFGLWVWHLIKRNRRREAEEQRARAEGRTSADTVVEGRDNELQVIGDGEQGKINGADKTPTQTTQTAV